MSLGKFFGKLLGLDEEKPTDNPPGQAESAAPAVPSPPEEEVEVFRMPSEDEIERAAVIRRAMTVHRAQQASLNSLTEEERQKLRSIAENTFLDPGNGKTRH